MVVKKASLKADVEIPVGTATLKGSLQIPEGATKIVLFVHGSGSSRLSPRNQLVAKFLTDAGMAILLFDLLTPKEEEIDNLTRELRFNIPFLAERLIAATEWIEKQAQTHSFSIGYFGASTGAAAALIAAAELGDRVKAVVSRGGRPDLAGHVLSKIQCPTLLIVGGDDFGVIELNQHSLDLLNCKKKLEIVPGATHLFEEPGALEEVGRMASLWLSYNL